ncbi:hypothetical protein [Mycolicibacterium phlei]
MMTRVLPSVGAALAATGLGLASATAAVAAPTGGEPADQVLDRLRNEGYTVVISRTGTGSIDECTVTEVRPGQTYSRTDSGVPNHLLGTPGPNIATIITGKTAHVTLKC